MKKKIIAMFAAVCAAVCCLSACGTHEKEDDGNEYDALNAMLSVSYSQIEIIVTNTFDEGVSLTSAYTIGYAGDEITVAYEVEKFAELSLDELSPDLKTVLSGEAVFKGGALASVNGDDIGLTADIAQLRLDFQAAYFENAVLADIALQADVKDASAFLGTQVDCSDMRVEATFLEAFLGIDITYTSESGNQVEYRYIFTL